MFDTEYQHEKEGSIIDAFTRKILLQEKNALLFELLEEQDSKDPKEQKDEKKLIFNTTFNPFYSITDVELKSDRLILKNDLRSRIDRDIRMN